jgi:pyruvate formate lyase activating enzyme
MLSSDNKLLPIGGFLKQSLIDYPGNISSVVFTQGCNFRCVYCHNPDLVWPERIKKSKKLDAISIINWINKNHQLLDAVVITGGEPTMHESLHNFIVQLKDLGLKVKLDTNGTNPEVVDNLLSRNLLDYIAMDVKAPLKLEDYKNLAGSIINRSQLEKIKSSIELIRNSKIEFEFRTTVLEKYHTKKSIENIVKYVASSLYLQNYKSFPGKENNHLKPFKNLQQLVASSQYNSNLRLRE